MDRLLEGLKILLVEEEVLIAMDVEQLCYDLGAAAVATISSDAYLTSEALDTREEVRTALLGADAAILDAKVGGDWTLELARRLKQRRVPFVFATGYPGTEPLFAEFPDVPVIGKPYSGLELPQAVARMVALTRSGEGG
ncbi:response regulator [Chelativorans sp.]|uniref:response regulator n=1 Tax=Chelativorans sp. TaxID=2203393 RepID=UPI0028120EF5|nr:response regulator [Chelativorans sp.]